MTEKKDTQSRKKQTRQKKKKQLGRKERRLALINLVLILAILIALFMLFGRWVREVNRPDLAKIVTPDWIEQELLDKNPYSRPGDIRTQVNDIVVHYVANPGSSARMNRNYFNNQAKQPESERRSVSSHFIIDIDGTILQCVPIEEIAYANYPRNADTVSIECCHPDSTGEFTEETKASLYKLTAWLCGELKLTENHVIRHYDVNGKNCPKYYVEDEDAWKALKKEMKKIRKES